MVENEWIKPDTDPDPPPEPCETRYGVKFWPSNRAEDAELGPSRLPPDDEMDKAPETRSIRLSSMMPFEGCVETSGTIVNEVTLLVLSSEDPEMLSMSVTPV
jgi:hypothetical protein